MIIETIHFLRFYLKDLEVVGGLDAKKSDRNTRHGIYGGETHVR